MAVWNETNRKRSWRSSWQKCPRLTKRGRERKRLAGAAEVGRSPDEGRQGENHSATTRWPGVRRRHRCSADWLGLRLAQKHPQLRTRLTQVDAKGNPGICPLKCPHKCPPSLPA